MLDGCEIDCILQQSNSSSSMNTTLEECDPIIFTSSNPFDVEFEMNYISNDTIAYPVCRVWDESNDAWNSSTCWVYNYNITNTKCACTQLGIFSVSYEMIQLTTNITHENKTTYAYSHTLFISL